MDNKDECGAPDNRRTEPLTVGPADGPAPDDQDAVDPAALPVTLGRTGGALADPTDLIAEDAAAARRYTELSRAPSTLRAYAVDWAAYLAWCGERGFAPLPSHPAQVALFIGHQADAGLAVPSINRRLAAIAHHHRRARQPLPSAHPDAAVMEDAMAGVRRARAQESAAAPGGKRRGGKKKAATADLVRAMLDAIPESGLRNLRDRALLAFGLATAMRRSELAALRVEHLTWTRDGVDVLVPLSKTDQEGKGAVIAVPRGLRIRPVLLLETWLGASGITEGPVFRRMFKGDRPSPHPMSGEAIALVAKERASAVGLDPAAIGAHSLRSGFLTSAAESGATVFKMQSQSRHKSLDVLAGYVQDADRYKDHAGGRFL
ncbi:site-specific integrase [Azospirillum ramasamyi]|uniref:Integrase n=1 Tax=Azospirillum ramasamyi TaxID=682998 RepID=A0A2U9SGB7_9PROT|nr:site-specific integrase [Azospirillum ramasamyi]AWU98071.1 integrase [Azospirillum ramasamyi]